MASVKRKLSKGERREVMELVKILSGPRWQVTEHAVFRISTEQLRYEIHILQNRAERILDLCDKLKVIANRK